ncbi:MAG: prepilin peptidase [Pirellulales bacterium]|nr:prepilin peptidase [Pirellulales bacterium]
MNFLPAIPIEGRIVAVFLLGAVLGALANLATYRLAWRKRAISPHSTPDASAPARCWFDRVPVFGWLGLWRETPLHGRGFWIRPMTVELSSAFGLAWLYYWEVVEAGLLVPELAQPAPAAWQAMLHTPFAAHAVLLWLMLVASLIDVDEKTIPDSVTVSGTVIGLLLALFFPLAALPEWRPGFWEAVTPEGWPTMAFNSPGATTDWPDGYPLLWPLVVALGCWLLWCFGLLRRDWYTRHGLGRAVQLCLARLARDPSTIRIGFLATCGVIALVMAWAVGGRGWTSLVSALIGMAAAGGLVWAIRLIGAAVLRREAMGFGDVTLMAMIGVYFGWQASILVFFFAPLAAVIVGLVVLVLCRDNVIPFGPFLCLAALFVLLRWPMVWNWSRLWFEPNGLVPGVILGCLALLAVLLTLLQIVKRLFFRYR